MVVIRMVVLALTISPALAQLPRTWIVDEAGGAGSSFTAIQPAVNAATAGDTIIVRAGRYVPPIVGKGLRIVGRAGATLDTTQGSFSITSLPAGDTVAVSGFASVAAFPLRMRLTNNRGAIHLQDLTSPILASRSDRQPAIFIQDCSLVSMNRCQTFGTPAVGIIRSNCSLTDCELQGMYIWIGSTEAPALVANSSRLAVTRPRFTGANDNTANQSTAAVQLTDTQAEFTGDVTSFLQGGMPTVATSLPAIDRTRGQVTLDPSLPLNPLVGGANALSGSGSITMRELASVHTPRPRATPGGALTVEVSGPPNSLSILAASRSAPPTSLSIGRLWLDPVTAIAIDVGTLGLGSPRGVLRRTYPVPPFPALIGATTALQAVVMTPAGFRLSTPTLATVGL